MYSLLPFIRTSNIKMFAHFFLQTWKIATLGRGKGRGQGGALYPSDPCPEADILSEAIGECRWINSHPRRISFGSWTY